MSLLEDLRLKVTDSIEAAADTTDKYRRGEVGMLTQGIQGAATALSPFTAIAQEAAEAATPDWLEDLMAKGGEKLLATETGQQFVGFMAEHPELAQNAGNVMEVAELFGVSKMPAELARAFNRIPVEYPNKLDGFYGNGAAGQVQGAAKAAPQAFVDIANSSVNPRARALAREGIPSALQRVAKDNVKKEERWNKGITPLQKAREIVKKARGEKPDTVLPKDNPFAPSWVAGQADQTNLLNVQAGRSQGRLDEVFSKKTTHDVVEVGPEGIKRSFEANNPEQYAGMDIDQEMVDRMANHVTNVWTGHTPTKGQFNAPVPEGTPLVIRKAGEFDQLDAEAVGRLDKAKGGKKAKAKNEAEATAQKIAFSGGVQTKGYALAEEMYKKLWPEKTQFDSPDELLEHAALGYLAKEKGDHKAVGNYLLKKKMDQDGKLTDGRKRKPYLKDKEIVDKYVDRLKKGKNPFDSKGRLYLSMSHLSGAKGLGGVNNLYVFDKKGNRLTTITDENDLFGLRPAGSTRVISIVPPARTNAFGVETGRKPKKTTPHNTNARKLAKEIADMKPESYKPEDFQGLFSLGATYSASQQEEE